MALWYAQQGYEMVFVSGRPDTYRAITEQWLSNHIPFEYKVLFMRRAGDHRPDNIAKKEILHTYFPDISLINVVIDDRRRVLEMWASQIPHAHIINVGGEENDF